MEKSQLRKIIKQSIKEIDMKLQIDKADQQIMLDFLNATDKAPNQDEILEKFEKVMNAIIDKKITKMDMETAVDQAQEEI